jgi:hypothetical protein
MKQPSIYTGLFEFYNICDIIIKVLDWFEEQVYPIGDFEDKHDFG